MASSSSSSSSNSAGCSKSLRSKGEVEDLLAIFPLCEKFEKEKLPSNKEVVGLVRKYSETLSFEKSIAEVSSTLYDHWISRNVYPITVPGIKKKLSKEIDEFRYITRTDTSKRGKKWKDRYENFSARRNKLFDIFCENKEQRKKMEDRYSIPMLKEDFDFLESMRGDRKGRCETKTDIKWHKEAERKRASRERYQKRQSAVSETVSSLDIPSDSDTDTSSDTDVDTNPFCSYSNQHTDIERDSAIGGPTVVRKKARYIEQEEADQNKPITRASEGSFMVISEESAELPLKYRNIRESQRNVRDEVYWAMAELDGLGFSYREAQLAIVTVGNILFGTKWKLPAEATETDENEAVFDCDTLPTRKNIRKQLKNMEAYSLKLVGEKVIAAKASGATVTHATDSTTRKYVGSFAPAGLHINKDEYVPLPTLPITTETTRNVADSVATDFKLLEAASGYTAEDLYSAVDVHMTDSTAHNKGISDILATEFSRTAKAGQIFCDTHTALGFDRGMSKEIHDIEEKMGMENIFNTFLLDVDVDQKKDSVSMTAVSWCLNLFGPDNIQKPWNYNKDFCLSLKDQGKQPTLFHLKDARFGALSKSCAIMCYHWNDFWDFLEEHDYITNKLACLVRDALALEYIKIVAAVVAVIGIQLVTPFHALTISKGATHSNLKATFESLYHELNTNDVTENFFELETPGFSSVSKDLFKDVKNNYGLGVVNSVKNIAKAHQNDCITLTKKILPQMAQVLAMQRGKYYGFGDYPQEYPVFDQCEDIDNTPVHNLQMERQCGDTDQRLKKKVRLDAVARGTVLKETSKLRTNVTSEYRKMGPVVTVMDEIKYQWKLRQEELQVIGLSKKEANLLRVENRKLNILDKLKLHGGPFTSEEEIDVYFKTTKDNAKEKSQRMRDEVTYARDTSVSLPKASAVFRIFNTDGGKRKMLTPEQFAFNLKTLLGKKNQRSSVTLADFQKALNS